MLPEFAENQRFSSVAQPATDPHLTGEYLKNNPTWHVEFSPWKATNILGMLKKNGLCPKTICDVGCGAGEVLRQLQLKMSDQCRFWGFDVAPDAIRMAKERENKRLQFDTADLGVIDTPRFDLMLALEVVDHVEDYLGFLRMLKPRSEWKIFSFSLDISVQAVLRKGALSQRRVVHCHRHHFSTEIVLLALQETGYQVVDWCYYYPQFEAGLARLARPIRALAFQIDQDLAVRFFGGYSMLILAR